jgi:outer membrane protein OmpA-like peptidoglycan-associated protein
MLRSAGVLFSLAWASGLLSPGEARAQATTFTLDRMVVPGGPDDGIAIYRPVTQDKPLFFAQIGLGYSVNPLHTVNVTHDSGTIAGSPAGLIQGQITQYTTAGFEFLDRFTASVTLPVTWGQWGQNPTYNMGGFAPSGDTATANTSGPAAGDTRIDGRVVVLRSRDRRAALGVQASVFVPTGTASAFGSDGQTTAMFGASGEYTFHIVEGFNLTLVGNLAVDLRPTRTFNAPTGTQSGADGLGVGDELRWAVAAFVPFKENKYRLGLTIFGQTGIENDSGTGNTIFANENNPIEWQAEGRMRFGKYDRFWVGAGAGSRLDQSYGAPDFRAVAVVGIQFPLVPVDAESPEQARAARRKRPVEIQDRDHDGIPDDIDACPDEPEDHLGADPNDGCPIPPDRDHDGIPDQFDKCPDVPEDKDGIDDQDGCPEDDADQDGIPDVKDACPKEPGQPDPDPKKNGCPRFIHLEGSSVRVLQQVHFQTGSATILPDSFPMLGEIAALLKATPGIKKMRIEGHTDSHGNAAMNLDLSQRRAASVRQWLIEHGIAAGRLESQGYGLTQPIDTNDTDAGRAANRRVEFKILEEDSGMNNPGKSTSKPASADE